MSDSGPQREQPTLRLVERMLTRERELLVGASGGAPLCRTSEAITPVKRHEGAVVALTRLRSTLLEDTAQAAGPVVERSLESWRREHETRQGTDWASYVEGGVRALTDTLERMARNDDALAAAGSVEPIRLTGHRAPVLASPAVAASGGTRWTRRRVVAATALAAALGAALLTRALSTLDASWPATATALAAVVLAAAAMATFVPARGPLRQLDLGCGPCAVAGGLLAGGAAWLAVADPTQLGSATMAFGLAGVALVQRLSQPAACPSPAFTLPPDVDPDDSSEESSIQSPSTTPPAG